MSVFLGGYIPGFRFRLQVDPIQPSLISNASSGVFNTADYDAIKTTIISTGAITGSQYQITIVPERYVFFGNNPIVSLSSSDSGIAGVDNTHGNTSFVSTGIFSIIGAYDGNSYYQGQTTQVKILNTSGGGNNIQTVSGYTPTNLSISNNVLIIYNSGSINSINLKDYYTGHRSGMSSANILGILCPTGESLSYATYNTGIRNPIINFLTGASGIKPIKYIIMMQDIPTRISDGNRWSVPYNLSVAFQTLNLRNGLNYRNGNTRFTLAEFQGTTALISYINFGTYNDSVAYIDKLASANYYNGYLYKTGAANYYFDDYQRIYSFSTLGASASGAVAAYGVSPSNVQYNLNSHISTGNNLAGYQTWGSNGGQGGLYANTGAIVWGQNSDWYIISTIESYNGQRSMSASSQGNYAKWFSTGAFGGTGYEKTPIGACCTVEEPGLAGVQGTDIFGSWAGGWCFGDCAWESRNSNYYLILGDPLVILNTGIIN